MRIQEIRVYEYHELSYKAKEKALYEMNDRYWSDGYIYEDIKDNCALFDIPEIDKKFKIDNSSNILLGNNRGDLFYTTEGNFYLNCTSGMVVNDYEAFYQWLQLDKKIIDKIQGYHYELFIDGEVKNRSYITTYLEFNNRTYKQIPNGDAKQIEKAKTIFDNHIYNIWKRIKDEYEYMLTSEYFLESGIVDNYEFLASGKIY